MIILDTGVLFALSVEKDVNHSNALKIVNDSVHGAYGKIAITDYIFDETVTLALARTKSISKAVSVGDYISNIEIIKVDQDVFDGAWKMFKTQDPKMNLSFTDCTTAIAMKRNHIDKVATFDSGFTRIKWVEVVN